jgi:hypothetical protein
MAEATKPVPVAAAATPAPAGPHYDPRGRLTMDGMKHVHASGGSVLYKGRIIPPGSALPPESDLAAGDSEHLKRIQADNDAKIKALQAENDSLKAQIHTSKTDASKDEPKKDDPKK